jgi:HK97 family phage major capsid protein
MADDTVTQSDLQDAIDQMADVWKSEFQEYQERSVTEESKFGDAFPETKEALDEIQDDLDRFEERFRNLQHQKRRQEEQDDVVQKVLGNVEVPATKDREVFDKYLRKGRRQMAADERKVLTTTDDTGAGYLAPPEFVAQVIRDIVEMSPVRELADVRSTSRSYTEIPRRTATGEAIWVNENETRNEVDNPDYGMIRINNHALHALHLATHEELEDSVVDLEAAIRNDITEQIAKAENKAFIQGNGADKPEGILEDDDIQEVVTGDSSKITDDGLIDLHYAIKTPYSDRGGVWIMNRLTIREVRKLKDDDGRYIWNPGLAEDQQPTILESPYREATDLVEPDSDGKYATGEFPIIYGDFEEGYVISDRVQVAIQRLVEKFSDQGAVGFQARRRVGGKVVKPEALAIQRVAS